MSVVTDDDFVPDRYRRSLDWIDSRVDFSSYITIDAAREAARAVAKEAAQRSQKKTSSAGMERIIDSSVGTTYFRQKVTRNIESQQRRIEQERTAQAFQTVFGPPEQIKTRIDTGNVVL